MNKALNETLAALPDDTFVYVSLLTLDYVALFVLLIHFSSPDMSIPSKMSNSASPFPRPTLSRNLMTLLPRIRRRRGNLPLEMRRSAPRPFS
jgi:hypothetical protein